MQGFPQNLHSGMSKIVNLLSAEGTADRTDTAKQTEQSGQEHNICIYKNTADQRTIAAVKSRQNSVDQSGHKITEQTQQGSAEKAGQSRQHSAQNKAALI